MPVKIYTNMFDSQLIIYGDATIKNKGLHVSKGNQVDIERSYSSIQRSKSNFLDIAKNNVFNYFVTITISDNSYSLEKDNYNKIRKDLTKYFNYIKNRFDKNFKYLVVAEYGTKNTKRLHFHCLIYLENSKILKHIGSNYVHLGLLEKFGRNQWKKIKDYNIKCAMYCTKYFTKQSFCSSIFARSYFCSLGLKRSECITLDISYLEDLRLLQKLDTLKLIYNYDFCSVAYLPTDLLNILIKGIHVETK